MQIIATYIPTASSILIAISSGSIKATTFIVIFFVVLVIVIVFVAGSGEGGGDVGGDDLHVIAGDSCWG